MPTYVHNPKCYLANERGMVEKNEEYYLWLSFQGEDKRMFNGNEPVTIRFISDEMPATRHMGNGKHYTSKKKFREQTKAMGCIEVGDQVQYCVPRSRSKTTSQVYKEKQQRREDVKKAIHQLRNGRNIINEVKSIPKEW